MFYKQLVLLLLLKYTTGKEIDKEYALLPDVFYMDNYDSCMLAGDEAFYCSITYVLEPIDQNNPSKTWNYIKNISSIETNYRHDHLRHGVCVPKTCPEVTRFDENDPLLKKQLEDCYNKKFVHLDLKGNITEILCETQNPRYPVDGFDIACGIIFIIYLLFVLYATYYEGVASYKSPEEYQKITGTPTGKILSCFSIIKNWIRLTTINDTPDTKKLSSIQGLRVFLSSMLILSHSVLEFMAAPSANLRFMENVHTGYLSKFFGSANLAIVLFFVISDFLLSYELFKFMKDKQGLGIQMIIWILVARLFRQLPSLVFTVLLHATWLRHLGDGPVWYVVNNIEFKNCRNNGWTNLLFINNIVNNKEMCLAPTWYMAVSYQYFIISLFFIWFLKKYEKYFWRIIGTTLLLQLTAAFFQNYYHDFPCLLMFSVETFYGFKNFLASDEFQYKHATFIGNFTGPIFGIALGYYYYQHNQSKHKLFNKLRKFLIYLIFLLIIIVMVIPEVISTYYSNEHNAIWASIYVALCRPVIAFCNVILILAFTDGVGGIILQILQHPLLYILGRLAYSVSLIHMSIMIITAATLRYPTYTSYFIITTRYLGDFVLVYIAAFLLTLLVEFPVSALMKLIFVLKEDKTEEKLNNSKNK